MPCSMKKHKAFNLLLDSQNVIRYVTPSYTNQYGSGDREAWALAHVTTSGGALWAVIDPIFAGHYNGVTDDNIGYLADGIDVADKWLQWDFVDSHLVTEIKFYWNTGLAESGVWRVQGWNGASWVNVGNTFTLGTNLIQVIDLSGNTTGYTKYRMLGVFGNSSFNLYYWSEIQFKIGAQL